MVSSNCTTVGQAPWGGGGGGGGRLGPFFWVQNLNFNIFWGFQKNEYFGGGGGGGGV